MDNQIKNPEMESQDATPGSVSRGHYNVLIGENMNVHGHYCIAIGDNLSVTGVFQVVTSEKVTFKSPEPGQLRLGIQFLTQYINEINTRKGYPGRFVTAGTAALRRGIDLYMEKLQSIGETSIPNDTEKLNPIPFTSGSIVIGSGSSAAGPFSIVIGDNLGVTDVCEIKTGIPVTMSQIDPKTIPDVITIFTHRISELDTLPGYPPGYVEKARPLLCWLLDTCCHGAYTLLSNNNTDSSASYKKIENVE